MNYPEIVYDRRVIEWYMAHDSPEFWTAFKHDITEHQNTYKEVRKFFDDLGYYDMYFGGLKSNMVRWVPVGSIWRVGEYDGAEYIDYFNLAGWNQFK